MVIPTAVIYYRKEYKAKSAKGRVHRVSLGKPGTSCKGSSPRESHTDVFNFLQGAVSTREVSGVARGPGPGSFAKGQVTKGCARTHPEGKQVFGIYMLFVQRWGESPCSCEVVGTSMILVLHEPRAGLVNKPFHDWYFRARLAHSSLCPPRRPSLVTGRLLQQNYQCVTETGQE